MRKLLKRRSGEGYIDVCVLVVCAMLVLALVVRVLPVYITKQPVSYTHLSSSTSIRSRTNATK